MQIFISGHFGARNLGDELILLSELELFNSLTSNTEFFIYSYNKKTRYYQNYPFKIKLVQAFNFRNILNAFYEIIIYVRKSDLIIVGGGGLIQDKYLIVNPFSVLLPALIGIIYNKPIVAYSLGVYKLRHFVNKVIFRFFFLICQRFFVRDSTSLKNVNKLINFPQNKLELLNDSALNLEIHYNRSAISQNYSIILIREVFRNVNDEFAKFINNVLKEINIHKCVLIPFEDAQNEYETIFSLRDYLIKIDPNLIIEIKNFPSLKEYFSLLEAARIVISGRLHGCISSYILDKKAIGISYEDKVSDFCYWAAMPFVPINNIQYSRELLIAKQTDVKEKIKLVKQEHCSVINQILNSKRNKTSFLMKLISVVLIVSSLPIIIIGHFARSIYEK